MANPLASFIAQLTTQFAVYKKQSALLVLLVLVLIAVVTKNFVWTKSSEAAQPITTPRVPQPPISPSLVDTPVELPVLGYRRNLSETVSRDPFATKAYTYIDMTNTDTNTTWSAPTVNCQPGSTKHDNAMSARSALRVAGVIIEEDSKKALFMDRFVTIDQVVGGYVVLDIQENKVLLRDDCGDFELKVEGLGN